LVKTQVGSKERGKGFKCNEIDGRKDFKKILK
jgi:hypothetical protein